MSGRKGAPALLRLSSTLEVGFIRPEYPPALTEPGLETRLPRPEISGNSAINSAIRRRGSRAREPLAADLSDAGSFGSRDAVGSCAPRVGRSGRRGFRGLDYDRALLLLDAIDAAPSHAPLKALQAVRLHTLKGDRQGRLAITVNRRWRITFRFTEGEAYDVVIEDYHRG